MVNVTSDRWNDHNNTVREYLLQIRCECPVQREHARKCVEEQENGKRNELINKE